MLFRLTVFIFLCLFASCSSEAPEEKKTDELSPSEKAESQNAQYERKAEQAITNNQLKSQKYSSHNEGFIMATQPEMKVDQEKFKIVFENAVKGDPDYQYSLAMCYKYGYAVKVDTEQALFWFKKAADQGHKQAERVYNFMIKRK